ncbi:cuticle protein 7-like [Tribolium madens]|uniref:cuticle protein 7-like n=1 Tax=Tribolium madens TaxID=41895 RepID=UPI001CF730BE|nr:cuticle protein 7-like [Tribolium madens]
MKFLVALSCVLAVACAKPDYAFTNYAHPLAYSTFAGAPIAHHAVAAAPIAHHAVVAAPIAHTVAAPVVEKTQYHSQDALGQASYGHSEPLQAHHAVQDAAGNKAGSYSYVAPDGQVISANYVADALGYRVASNALPVGPAVPAETPEVVAARVAHFNHHALVRSRARRDVVAAYHTPYVHSAYYAAPVYHHAAAVVPHAVSYHHVF